MNFIKRGAISIQRQVGKSLVFLGIIMLFGGIVAGAIIIDQTINRTTDHLRRSTPTIITLGRCTYNEPSELITGAIVEKIAELNYVSYFDYSVQAHGFSSFYHYNPELPPGVEGEGGFHFGWDGINSFSWLTGVARSEFIYIDYGLFELVEGRLFAQDEIENINLSNPTPILVLRNFAELNELSVGMMLKLYSERFHLPENANVPDGGFVGLSDYEIARHPYNIITLESYSFEVIGILEIDLLQAQHMESYFMQDVIYNTLFVPNWKTELMQYNIFESQLSFFAIFQPEVNMTLDEWMGNVLAFWILDDPVYMDSFREAALSMLPDGYIFADFSHIFDPLHNAMMSIGAVTNRVLLFTGLATIISIGLLITLYLRDRTHELGIYLALGEKRGKIISQILFEVIIVGVIGLSLAIFIGNSLAPIISQELLVHELTDGWSSTTEIPSQIEFSGLARELSISELSDYFDVSIDTQTIGVFFAVGITTITISTIVPVFYIVKLNKKKF